MYHPPPFLKYDAKATVWYRTVVSKVLCEVQKNIQIFLKESCHRKKHVQTEKTCTVRNEILGSIKGYLSISPDKRSIYMCIMKLVNRTRFKTLLPAISPSISFRYPTWKTSTFQQLISSHLISIPRGFWQGTGI